jgi:hypothetical protein
VTRSKSRCERLKSSQWLSRFFYGEKSLRALPAASRQQRAARRPNYTEFPNQNLIFEPMKLAVKENFFIPLLN